MKQLTFFIAILFLSSFSIFAQNVETVIKSDLDLKQKMKAPDGTVYVNPILQAYSKKKSVPDTLNVVKPSAARFYFDTEAYTEFNDTTIPYPWYFNTYKSTVDITQMLKPFYIKQHEVTNEEYHEFLSDLGGWQQLKNWPDTNCWDTDFIGAYMEPFVKYYFNHEAYNSYPVVGVSYYQAKAYCKWYENRLNMKNKIDGYVIQVDLPNQFEWAFANGDGYRTSNYSPRNSPSYLNQYYDKNFLTNLILDLKEEKGQLINRAILPGYTNLNSGNFMNDGTFATHSCKVKKKKKVGVIHGDQVNGVFYLNNNVSEWCSETYKDNWAELFQFRQQSLKKLNTQESLLLAQLEAFHNSQNDTVNGRMVRGGNWVFEHHAYRDKVNVGTHSAKLFVDPNEQHSTLGFRYVIRLVPVNKFSEKK